MPAAEPAPSDAPEHDDVPPRPEGGRPLKVIALVTIVSFVGLWGYVMYLAFIEGRQPPVDRLDDPAFALAAELRCSEAVADVTDLPLATASGTPEERAIVLDDANSIFGSMLDDIEDLASTITDDEERERTEAWLADWRIFLGNREDHADRLREGSDSRLLVSEKAGEGRHITGWIDEFALANKMDSCISPDDA